MRAHHAGYRRVVALFLPVLLGASVVLGLYGSLLSSGETLAARDVATFHLPLRSDLARLLRTGDLSWNPYLHGGQPLLSNPSYAAFYPATWLVALVPPDTALDLSVLLHAALGFAGAWRLARRLGCGQGGAALAAVGFSASGGILSLVHALNLFTGMAWFPWVLAAGHAALHAPPGRWLWPAAGTAVTLALVLLNGEPVTVSIAGLGLLALAADRWLAEVRGLPAARGRPGGERVGLMRAGLPAGRIALCAALALALAAAQIVPTLVRLRDSPRAGALPAASTAAWSAPPQRVVELVWPRFFGDPMRVQEDLWFGRRLHDRDFPYVASLYPGLLIAILAAAALVRRSTPHRWAWWLAIGVSAFLALGRFNPAFPPLLEAVPWLGRVRYPEKYALLALGVLPFVAALGWERLPGQRPPDSPTAGKGSAPGAGADLPCVLALVATVASLALAAALTWLPGLAAGLVRGGGPTASLPATLAAGTRFLVGEAAAAAVVAALVAGLLALVRAGRFPARALTGLAVLLLAADLGRAGHGLVYTLPAAEYREPPPLIAATPSVRRGRLFSDQAFAAGPDVVLRGDEPRLATVRTDLRRLDPYTPNLWGLPLALHEDYDLMLTGWARHGLAALRQDYGNPVHALRILGAWDVRHLILRRPAEELSARVESGEAVEPAQLRPNPDALPRYRFVDRVERHPDATAALAAARANGFVVTTRDDWVGPGSPAGGSLAPPRPGARLLDREERGGRVRIDYQAPSGGYLVAAVTFDRGWQGAVDGEPVPVSATALGQIGVELPATGEAGRTLILRYRDRWVPVGISIALAAWLVVAGAALAGAGLAWRRRRRRLPIRR